MTRRSKTANVFRLFTLAATATLAADAVAAPVTYKHTGFVTTRSGSGPTEVYFTFDESAMDDQWVSSQEIIAVSGTTYVIPRPQRGQPTPEPVVFATFDNSSLINVSIPFSGSTPGSRVDFSNSELNGQALSFSLINSTPSRPIGESLILAYPDGLTEFKSNGGFLDTTRIGDMGAWEYVGPAAISGDTDGDGDIDDSDLGTSFANYTGAVGAGGGKTLENGDTDGDGDVDDADLGTSFAGYTGALGPVAVPEPAAGMILLAGLAGAWRRRRLG